MSKQTIITGGRHLGKKLKNEAYLKGLENEGINTDALRRDLKNKQNDNAQGISK